MAKKDFKNAYAEMYARVNKELKKLKSLYETNDLVSYYCESLGLYSVNYDACIDKDDLIYELYYHIYKEEKGIIYNESPFKGESGWEIAVFCRDRKSYSKRDSFFYNGEKFMLKMHKFLNNEIREKRKLK